MENWKYLGKTISSITLISEEDKHSFYKFLNKKSQSINTSEGHAVRERLIRYILQQREAGIVANLCVLEKRTVCPGIYHSQVFS